jgi:hypothetical protein
VIQDLSFIHEKTPEAQETAIRKAVEQECLRAISNYLGEVADAMENKGIESLNVPTLRAMAQELNNRLENDEN